MLNDLLKRYPVLAECQEAIENAKDALIHCYEKDGKAEYNVLQHQNVPVPNVVFDPTTA